MLNCDEYLMPESLDEAFDLIERHAGRYRIVAGATDLLPWAREGRAGDVHYPVLIDISRVPELDGVERRGDRLRLGANTTFADFLNDAELREALPIMPHVAVWFADDQIRELATLAGNLINASPAADGTPPMIALNGTVTLECRRDGDRRRRDPLYLAKYSCALRMTRGASRTVAIMLGIAISAKNPSTALTAASIEATAANTISAM